MSGLASALADALESCWAAQARPSQLPPHGDWRVWLLVAGRGYGKTRAGAEWINAQAQSGAAGARIALVAPTAADARDVMVEGQSGILATAPSWARPLYEPSRRRVSWPNGAVGMLFSADEPERLRGPQHSSAWCDELGAWRYPEAWHMLLFGLRLGIDPRVLVTTTPRPNQSIRVALGSRDSATFQEVTAIAAMPIGTLSRKTDSQPRPSVSRPPTRRPVDPHRHPPFGAAGELLGDQRQGDGEHHRAADALQAAGKVEEGRVGGERAEQRGEREDPQPDREHAPAPEPVGQRAGGEDECRQGEGVGVDHPLQVGEAAAEVLLDRGQRRVDDGDVE